MDKMIYKLSENGNLRDVIDKINDMIDRLEIIEEKLGEWRLVSEKDFQFSYLLNDIIGRLDIIEENMKSDDFKK